MVETMVYSLSIPNFSSKILIFSREYTSSWDYKLKQNKLIYEYLFYTYGSQNVFIIVLFVNFKYVIDEVINADE